MPRNSKTKCESCPKVISTKKLKRKKGKLYCHKCYLKQSKCLMPSLSKTIPKSFLPPKRKKRSVIPEKINTPPKMKGEKKVAKQVRLSITREEKNVLYRKFIAKGISSQDASNRIKELSEYSKELGKRIREEAKKKKLTDQQMQSKFLEGLARYSEEEQ